MTTLADLRAWLGTLAHDDLAALVAVRDDVLDGAPVRDLDDLAERLAHVSSVAAVLADLPTPIAEVLETLVSCGAGASVRRAAELLDDAEAPSPKDHLAAVMACADHLEQAALAWPVSTRPASRPSASTPPAGMANDGAANESAADHRLRLTADAPLLVNPGVLELLPVPWGLGRPLGALVAGVPADGLKRIVRAWGQPVPTRKADLVHAVETYLADPRNVRILLGRAAPEHAEVIFRLVRESARGLEDSRRRSLGSAEDDVDDDDLASSSFGSHFDPAAYRKEQAALTWSRDVGITWHPYGSGLTTWGLEIPAEVALALLPPQTRLPFHPAAPGVPTGPVTTDQVRSAASGAITDTLAVTMAVLESADRAPLTSLKSGGVGARELARLAKSLGTGQPEVRLALELASGLALLDHAGAARIGTSARFRDWRRREPAERAADLVMSWLHLPHTPTQDRTEDGKAQPALAHEWDTRGASVRTRLLGLVHGLDDAGITSADALAEFLAWRVPFLAWERFAEDVRAAWDEGHRLGVLALGAMSEPGRVALAVAASGARSDAAGTLADAFRGMLPATQVSALFGSDLTVVVPGSPAPDVVDLLDAVAVREARGSAATWRVTPDSVRRALDEGHDAERLLVRLGRLAASGLPQPLEYLVRDVARRHGHVGVQAASAVVVGEDPALLAEIAAHRSLRRLGLRQVAPTVLLARTGVEEVLTGLRGAGYLPVPLDDDGVRVIPRVADGDADADALHRPGPVAVPAAEASGDEGLDDADLALRRWVAEARHPAPEPAPEAPAEVAARLLRGEAPPVTTGESEIEATIARSARRISASERRQLAHAIATGGAVTIRYRASSGGITERVISDLVLVGGYVYAWCHLRQAERYFVLESILGVTPA